MSTDTGQQETEEFLPRARMRVKLEYADTMEEGALWEELERRYNAHDALVAALRDLASVPDIVGGPHDVPRYHCRYCGRDYSPVEGLDTPMNCPSDDCRAWQARAALAKAEGA